MRSLLLLLAATSITFAQTTPAPTATPLPGQGEEAVKTSKQILRVNLPGGTYEVAVGAIIAVTSHEYVVDAAARVTEVNIDTAGQIMARFYYIEPSTTSGPGGLGAATLEKVQGLVTKAAERSGTDAWQKVAKSYPTTTHARTVEYRLASKASLNKIFSNASKAFRTGRGEEMTVSD